MTQAEAATVQAVSTVVLVVLTAFYLVFVRRQSSASEESVDRLIQRDLDRQHGQLMMLFAKMMSLQSEAQRWLDTPDLIGHMHRNTLPEDFLHVDNPIAIRDAAASGGQELNEAVWEALESARDARRELSEIRKLADLPKGHRPSEPTKGFRQAISDVKERALKAANLSKQEADRLERNLEPV